MSPEQLSGVRISTFCTNNACVGVTVVEDVVGLVDTKSLSGASSSDADEGTGPALTFTREDWCRFLDEIKGGSFDLL